MMRLNLAGWLNKIKAGVDADNFTATGKSAIVHFCAPTFASGIDVTSSVVAATGTGYKPTKDGWLFIMGTSLSGVSPNLYVYDDGGNNVHTETISLNGNGGAAQGDMRPMPVSKSFSYRVNTFYSGAKVWFFPARVS